MSMQPYEVNGDFIRGYSVASDESLNVCWIKMSEIKSIEYGCYVKDIGEVNVVHTYKDRYYYVVGSSQSILSEIHNSK